MSPRGVPGSARCGTTSGYRAHQLKGERPCPACVQAKQTYDAEWRAADLRTQKSRLSARAQAKANGRLRAAHLEDYDRFYAEEKAITYRDAGLEPEGVRSW